MLLLQWFDRDPGNSLICDGILQELLGITIKGMQQRIEVSAQKQELVSHLQNYILHNHSKSIRLNDLAEHVQRSPNHITKIFKQVLKQTPIDYIHQIKVSIACEMLRNTLLTVAEISDYLGYCEQSYFHRIFKKFTGVTPSALQKGAPICLCPTMPSMISDSFKTQKDRQHIDCAACLSIFNLSYPLCMEAMRLYGSV